MATTYTTDLQKLYVAYFNRPADVDGLAFYEAALEANGGNISGASADFSASTEYTAEYAGLTNTQIIAKIYTNLFGHGPDVLGQAYWVDKLDTKTFTLAQIVAEVAGGAQGTDKTAFNNKVAAATAFTTALEASGNKAAYSTDDAAAAAKAFIAGVTTDATLTAAIDPTALAASVAAVVKAGTAFTVASGLADLDAATLALSSYIKGINLDDDTTTAGDADIAAAVTDAVTAIKLVVAGYDTTNSAELNAAYISDTQKGLNADLATKQAAYTAAVAAASKVAGLNDAINTQTTTDANLKSATTAETKTASAQLVAEVSYEALNSTTITINPDGSVAGLIKVSSTGTFSLETGITEAKNPGVTALLNTIKAELAAQKVVATATEAKLISDTDVALRDVGAGDATAAQTLHDATVTAGVTPAKTTTVTAAEVSATISVLKGQVAAGVSGADAALATYKTAVADFITDAGSAANNPLATAVANDSADVTAATKAVGDLVTAVTDLNTANAYQAKLDALKAAVTSATDAFGSHDYATPVTLSTIVGATSASDIFLAGSADSTIYNFNLQGKDVLYVGSGYTLNTGALTTGNNSVLEAFLIQNGANTEVHLETKAYGSASGDEIVITLTGVTATDLAFNNGIIAHV